MKFINKNSQIDRVKNEEIKNYYYDKRGVIINDTTSKIKIFAQETEIPMPNNKIQKKFLILLFRSVPFDPYGIDSNYENSANLKLKNVNEITFNYYLQYLQTRNLIYMTYAQRSFING